MPDNGILLVSGCAGGGTTYATVLLRGLGKQMGHEAVWADGIVWWGLVGNGVVPWSDTNVGPDFNLDEIKTRARIILHQVRDPLRTISSVLGTNVMSNPRQTDVLKRKWFEQNTPINCSQNPILAAAEYWYWWNILGENQAQWTYCIEKLPDVFEQFCSYCQVQPDRSCLQVAPIGINSKRDNPTYQDITWGTLLDLSPSLCEQIKELAHHYGYEVPASQTCVSAEERPPKLHDLFEFAVPCAVGHSAVVKGLEKLSATSRCKPEPECLRLDDIRGKHTGQSAVVCGTGPSLRHAGSWLKRHVVIAVNAAASLSFVGIEPDYFLSEDGAMCLLTSWCAVQKGTFTVCLLRYWAFPSAKQLGLDSGRVLYYEWRERQDNLQMSPSDERIVCHCSGAIGAVNLAVVMGCSPIYLIGCDCQREDGKDHFWEFPGQPHVALRPPWSDPTVRQTPDFQHVGVLGRWKAVVEANPELDLRDSSGGALKGIVRQVGLEELRGSDT